MRPRFYKVSHLTLIHRTPDPLYFSIYYLESCKIWKSITFQGMSFFGKLRSITRRLKKRRRSRPSTDLCHSSLLVHLSLVPHLATLFSLFSPFCVLLRSLSSCQKKYHFLSSHHIVQKNVCLIGKLKINHKINPSQISFFAFFFFFNSLDQLSKSK